MTKRILLTSFDIWLQDQQSNSSNDLLLEVAQLNSIPYDLTFLHQLPVNVQLASSQVVQKIDQFQPDYIVCCGMAASRKKLSIEVSASCKESVLQTTVDVEKLIWGAMEIEISYDCGKFVCEGLYYSVLDYLQQKQLTTHCIFVHIPVLTSENLPVIMADFVLIINRLALS
ncbi:peptidase C15 [Halotia branconii]|uniref:Peptidase C15 n=1 Tax=Halotia branconii CENA392 TaxID=1539056 RepID=A0AAJ6P9I3_9CYAN|nr:peptidase C15 [Halotia branconii]WGV25859.1 peptidase C15 [Halotia branconii CENA392]